MKTACLSVCLGALLIAPFVAGAAAAPALPAGDATISAVIVDPNAADVAEIRALGERAISQVGFSLVSEVTTVVARDGAERAVEVCHLKALPLTSEIVAGMPRITAVKRTSLRLRNPANAPDAAEKLVLDQMQKAVAAGDAPPKVLVQRIDLAAGKREWRVYRPLGILPPCAACHGPKENQSAALRDALQQRYPDDQATGYAVGEWRGLIRVTVAERPPPLPMPAMPTKKLPARKT